jgi:formate--tetrahydrofolate ligase
MGKADYDIASKAKLRPIAEIAEKAGLLPDEIYPIGPHIGKVMPSAQVRLKSRSPGKLILVSALTPTAAGEGKTTTTVGLGMALNRIGSKAIICLREPSLGPCFGMKGGAAGGGYSQVLPMEDHCCPVYFPIMQS